MSERESGHARVGRDEHGGHHGHGGHDHGHDASSTSSRKLAAVSAINLLGFIAELAGGLLFGPIALLGDAFTCTRASTSTGCSPSTASITSPSNYAPYGDCDTHLNDHTH